jgi:uncharacterized lipoprotein NlpE involved in copper resistance
MKKTLYTIALTVLAGLWFSCNPSTKKEKDKATTDTVVTTKPAVRFNGGVYKGTIPVGDRKENVTVTFGTDSTFTLEEIFTGSSDHVMANSGTWKYDAPAQKVYLIYKNLADRVTSFSVIDGKTIQMHSGSMQTKETGGVEYNLMLQ